VRSWLARQKLKRRLRRLQHEYYSGARDENVVVPEYIAVLSQLRATTGRHAGFLHIGSGGHHIDGWVNLDLAFDRGMTVCADASRSLPFRDGTIRRIFSEDFLEHLEVDHAVGVIRECRRVLRPDGAIRLVLPDLQAIVSDVYLGRRTEHLAWCKQRFADETPCEALNRHMRMDGEHRFLYDFEFLSALLQREGFSVKRQAFHVTDYPEFRYLDLRGFGLSLYVEASVR
jgi:predicted SAM-dependent methyltransferase